VISDIKISISNTAFGFVIRCRIGNLYISELIEEPERLVQKSGGIRLLDGMDVEDYLMRKHCGDTCRHCLTEGLDGGLEDGLCRKCRSVLHTVMWEAVNDAV